MGVESGINSHQQCCFQTKLTSLYAWTILTKNNSKSNSKVEGDNMEKSNQVADFSSSFSFIFKTVKLKKANKKGRAKLS